jgi:hypothetical protein
VAFLLAGERQVVREFLDRWDEEDNNNFTVGADDEMSSLLRRSREENSRELIERRSER